VFRLPVYVCTCYVFTRRVNCSLPLEISLTSRRRSHPKLRVLRIRRLDGRSGSRSRRCRGRGVASGSLCRNRRMRSGWDRRRRRRRFCWRRLSTRNYDQRRSGSLFQILCEMRVAKQRSLLSPLPRLDHERLLKIWVLCKWCRGRLVIGDW